jgi:hypothetical protein
LVLNQLRPIGERHDRDHHAAPVELVFQRLHLAEVRLARQSSEVPQKDQ